MKRWVEKALRVLLTIGIFSSSAFAHPMKGVGDFYAGMLHPLITVETLLPLLGLSLLAGQQARETAIRMIVIFPAALAIGTPLILVRPLPAQLTTSELLITACLGLLIALARCIPAWIPIGLTVLIGLSIGWSNSVEIVGDVSAVRFVAGLSVVGLLMTSYGIGLVRHLKLDWMQIAVRVVGSWLATVGILVLGLK
jgi:urease accessory protein